MTEQLSPIEEVAPGVFRIRDTCNVYLIVAEGETEGEGEGEDKGEGAESEREGRGEGGGAGSEDATGNRDQRGGASRGIRTAVAIDFGSGAVLDHLDELQIDRITDVLMTHHHRDQAQGLPRAVEHGARIHVPPAEVDLFARVDEMWQTRQFENDYNVRQDRFSLLESVPVAGTVPLYRSVDFGGVLLRGMPTPGHTMGSVSYLLERGGSRIAFTGDLIYAPGKVWSLAASQWSYTAHEGPAMTVLSCFLLQDENADLLLPSHGHPMADARAALGLLADRMQYYVNSRRWHPWDLHDWLRNPFVALTSHLLINRTSMSSSYLLLSETGEALQIDGGYDMTTGLPTGTDRAARLPWLASLRALKQQFGVSRIIVALPTHYHDDHVAGLPLLREVEGTEIWSPANVAPILDDPMKHDLPCQWFEPIPSDRVLPLGETFTWNEYSITVHEQPGHTLFAAAFEVEVDGVTVMFTGDQQENLGIRGERNEILNYQYRNRFQIGDYRASGQLYRRVAPGLLLSGHWQPRWVDEGYLDYLTYAGEDLIEMHEALLPLDELDLGADGVLVRLEPYRSRVPVGASLSLTATVRNPHDERAEAVLRSVLPSGWTVAEPEKRFWLAAGEERSVAIELHPGAGPMRRARVAVDATIGSLRLGQHAEALVDVVNA